MEKKNILVIGGYSSTNIGNAFYEMGAKYLFHQMGERFSIHTVSDLSFYYWDKFREKCEGFEPVEHFSGMDYIVWLGPIFDVQAMSRWKNVLDRAKDNDVKIICMSAGGNKYSDAEVSGCREIMNGYPFHILMTRDTWTYKAYKECFDYAYDGICTAFFSPLCCNAWNMDVDPYVVFDFESHTEPKFIKSSDGFTLNGSKWRIRGGITARKNHPCHAVLLRAFEFAI